MNKDFISWKIRIRSFFFKSQQKYHHHNCVLYVYSLEKTHPLLMSLSWKIPVVYGTLSTIVRTYALDRVEKIASK